MALVLEVLGILGGSLATIPLFGDLFAKPVEQTTTVRVHLGSSPNLADSLGGNIPSIGLWDELGQSIGTSIASGDKKPQGNFVDIKIVANATVGNVPPAYVSVSAGGTDGICISLLSMTFPDGSSAAWNGDVAFQCRGQRSKFFESILPISSEGSVVTPKCVWIDRDGTSGIEHQGFGFHVRDFFNVPEQIRAYNKTLDLLCNSGPRFRMYTALRPEDPVLMFRPPLNYTPEGLDADPSRVIRNPGVFTDEDQEAKRLVCTDPSLCDVVSAERCRGVSQQIQRSGGRDSSVCINGRLGDKQGRRTPDIGIWSNSTGLEIDLIGQQNFALPQSELSWKFDGEVIISTLESHSASRLCEHPDSWGPSLVSMKEMKMCEMRTRTLYDVCSSRKTTCCFNDKLATLMPCTRGGPRPGLFAGFASNETKPYTRVSRWDL
jgi:hypothetical protein